MRPEVMLIATIVSMRKFFPLFIVTIVPARKLSLFSKITFPLLFMASDKGSSALVNRKGEGKPFCFLFCAR
jgi:hypothetical protein